jgi:hypothetical protein
MKREGGRIGLGLLAAVLALNLASPAAEQGLVWGRIVTPDGRPIAGARVVLSFLTPGLRLQTASDRSGVFRLSGTPLGPFSVSVAAVSYKPCEVSSLEAAPAGTVFLEVTLSPASDKIAVSRAAVSPMSRDFSETILSRKDEEALPTGNNIWNLIENQDLSATSNRIDVGGLWTGIPALLSGRGSASWTQTAYLLNGMDVTDPYRTGTPLFYPDFFDWEYLRLVNADLPLQAWAPGAYFDIITPAERPGWHGGLAAFYADKNFSSRNITPALEEENLTDNDTLRRLADFNVRLSGPLSRTLSFSLCLTSQTLSRHAAEFAPDDESSVLSGTAGLKLDLPDGSALRLLWTGQNVRDPYQGAARKVDPAATLKARDAFNVVQALWEKRFSPSHSLRAGLGLAVGDLASDFQADARDPNRSDVFLGQDQGAAAEADRGSRLLVDAFADGQAFLGESASVHHLLQYGLKLGYSSASTQRTVLDGLRLVFFDGRPLEAVRFNTPATEREVAFRLNVYGGETLLLGRLLSVSAGLNAGFTRGWVPASSTSPPPGWTDLTPSRGGRVSWLNLSPRFAVDLPLSNRRVSFVRISATRTYFALPLSYLGYGNPGALGGLAYSWNDANGDGEFQASEAGTLLRREGPLFGEVDEALKPPSVDELMVALNLDLGKRWTFTFAGYLRETRNLVAALNTGVPLSSYDGVTLNEAGDDGIAGDYDDLTFTVFNQKPETLGRDFYLLTNADSASRVSRYRGADITFVKRPGGKFDFFFSLQAIEAVGSANPGNSELENDDGVVGTLYADPNTLINAKGRLRYDRGFTARLGFSFRTVAGIRLGCVIKYYDGQPFARNIIVTGFNQGPFFIMAHPRGVARYEYNRTIDVRVERAFLLGPTRLRLILDGFNILNRSLATEENEWTGPDWPLRFATEIQSPRLFRLGLAFDF